MAVRAFHPIVLAGALLALPAVVAWAPVKSSLPTKPLPELSAATAVGPSTIVLPIEIAEQGYAPVQKQIEIRLETVPEPSSLVLLTAGSLLLLRRRRSN